MPGGYLQLAAYGSQDFYLTGNPQISFFKTVYRRYTNFAMDYVRIDPDGNIGLSETEVVTYKFKIERNADLISNIYFSFTLPDIYSGNGTDFRWIKNIGFNIISKVSMYIGGSLIDEHYGEWFDIWKKKRLEWHLNIGIDDNSFRYHDHDKLAHYADAACDIEFLFPFGFKELEGIHSRTDFDLKSHEKLSGKKIQYFDPVLDKNYTPYVVETSIGLDRMFLAILTHSFKMETLVDGSTRNLMSIPKQLAPNKLAFLPLLKKDRLPEYTTKIMKDFKHKINIVYDEKDAIGRRYRRQDAIGTPYCITIDHQTLKDDTFTLRDRDSMEQKRIKINQLKKIVEDELTLKSLLKNLNN